MSDDDSFVPPPRGGKSNLAAMFRFASNYLLGIAIPINPSFPCSGGSGGGGAASDDEDVLSYR